MKIFRKLSKWVAAFVLVLALAGGCMCGCAKYGVWSDSAKASLTAFGLWADEWVGGMLKYAPAIIAKVAGVVGDDAVEIVAANDAVKAAQAALGSYHAVVDAGLGAEADAEQKVITALDKVSAAMGDVAKVAADLGVDLPLSEDSSL